MSSDAPFIVLGLLFAMICGGMIALPTIGQLIIKDCARESLKTEPLQAAWWIKARKEAGNKK